MPTLRLLPLLASLAAPELGQNPGQRIIATVEVRSVTPHTDTTGVSYLVRVAGGSPEALLTFTVDAPGGVLRMTAPTNSWTALSAFQGRPVAHWISEDSLGSGSVTPELHLEVLGLPGILTYWIGGYFALPSAEDGEDIAPSDPLATEMINGKTVGVDPWPTDRTSKALIARLRTLTQASCATPLRWITSASLCTRLLGHLTTAETQRAGGKITKAKSTMATYSKSLAGKNTGTYAPGVTHAAYWLLKPNADIVVSKL